MDILGNIPNEVLDEILSYIPTFHPSLGDLYTCCLVNKFFNSIATPVLYRHIVLRIGTRGFANHVVRSLLSKQYQSHRFIREISVEVQSFYEDAQFLGIFNPEDVEKTAIHIAAFVESLAEEQLQSLNSEVLDIFKYVPPLYHAKIKSLHCSCALLTEDFSRKPLLPSLRALTYRGLSPFISEIGPSWPALRKYTKRLTSLSLESDGQLSISPQPNFLERIGFETLEHLKLRGFRTLETKDSSVLNLIPLQNVRKLEIIDCQASPALLAPQMARFTNLTNLAFYGISTSQQDEYLSGVIDDMLLNLSSLLYSLHWTAFAYKDSEYPSKRALQRHSATLRKLWLEIGYRTRNITSRNLRRSHYQYETKYQMKSIPIRSEVDGVLDLEALSQLPHVEYLAIPVAAPERWTSWAPSFPKLRSFYLVNSCKLYSTSARPATKCFRQEWINWFTSSHRQDQDGPNHLALQLVAFQRPACNWENRISIPQPGSRGFTAHVRDPNRPGYFTKNAITSETVRYLYPKVWDFFKGYFMLEKRDYVSLEGDTNVAKGIFEDEDEHTNLPGTSQPYGVALQDYQMQLMLLEQQNKKRLLMARAEQDAAMECPIKEPDPIVVAIPPWGVDEDSESEPFSPLHVIQDQAGQNPDGLANFKRCPSAPKSLREYQNDFLLFDEQMQLRRQYIEAHVQKATAEMPTPPPPVATVPQLDEFGYLCYSGSSMLYQDNGDDFFT
ncbi:hypothetical protein TWF281_001473 [Arthrobotrys megalospora]